MAEHLAPIGLALVRPAEIMGAEPYFHELIAGIERVTLPLGHSVLLRVLSSHESELDIYAAWAARAHVSGVLIVDVLEDDPRPAYIEELGLPAVIIGPPGFDTVTTVWTDDDEAMREAVRRFASLGHEEVAHVGGPPDLLHSKRRRAAFIDECEILGLTAVSLEGDYSRRSGASAVLQMIEKQAPATAVIFDSDLMALGALDALHAQDLDAPERLSIMAWDDSALCQLASPPVSAVSRDTQAVGQLIGKAIADAVRGLPPQLLHAPKATIVERGSSGPRTVIQP